jgi:hypothetical protein
VRPELSAAALDLAGELEAMWALGAEWVVFRRGLVEEVSLPRRDFLRRARRLFLAAPLLDVRLSDTRPAGDRHGAFWAGPRRRAPRASRLPLSLWGRLPGDLAAGVREGRAWFRSPNAARAALGVACVGHGRDLAGLPPLG